MTDRFQLFIQIDMSSHPIHADSFLLTAISQLNLQVEHYLLPPSFPPEPNIKVEIQNGPAGWFAPLFMKLESEDPGAEIRITNARQWHVNVVYFVDGKFETRLLPNGESIPFKAGTPFTFVSLLRVEFVFEIVGSGQVVQHVAQ